VNAELSACANLLFSVEIGQSMLSNQLINDEIQRSREFDEKKSEIEDFLETLKSDPDDHVADLI
jgi:hypothetical protein